MKQWLTAAQIAALKLPGMPSSKRGVARRALRENWTAPARRWPVDPDGCWRNRQGLGGGVEFSTSLLPPRAQAALAAAAPSPPASLDPPADLAASADLRRRDAWARFEALSDRKRAVAAERLAALHDIDRLALNGLSADDAALLVANRRGLSKRTLYNWKAAVAGVDQADWLPFLAPHDAGGAGRAADCDALAWEFLKADWLRLERPSFESCWRRLQTQAAANGWTLPSSRTMRRRLDALPRATKVAARKGMDALKRLYPAQERDRSCFHALEAANADGHKFDVWVRWPDGEIARPTMVAFQDLYSGLILSWRVDRTENRECVRLALADMVDVYGIPDRCWFDNGRGFASKWITGGMPNRYRFKVREDDPAGVLTQLGVQVHWAQPSSGQSKPIERAFRDFCDSISKDPRFAGAWTGNRPDAKPENYRSVAVDLQTFHAVLAEGIAEHNARPGRRSAVAAGRSFLETFRASYESAPIRTATDEQRRMLLMCAEGVSSDRATGAVRLLGNRYWNERLVEHAGSKLMVRFDPQDLHDGVYVYRLDGQFVCAAECLEAAGFADASAGREHQRARKAWLKAQADMLKAERRLSVTDVAAMLPIGTPAPEAPQPTVVRPLFAARGGAALKVDVDIEAEIRRRVADEAKTRDELRAGVARLRLVPNDDAAGL